jgi:hypothetical protein
MTFITAGPKCLNLDCILYVYKGLRRTKIVFVCKGRGQVLRLTGKHRNDFHMRWANVPSADKKNRYYLSDMNLWIYLPRLEALEFYKKEIDGEPVFHARLISVCKPIILRGQAAAAFREYLRQQKQVL